MNRTFLLLAAFVFPISMQGEEPAEFVRRVYSTNHPEMMAYIPDRQIAGFFTDELQILFQTARDIDVKFEARFPNRKPPFADRNVFTPSSERFSSFRVISSSTTDERFPRTAVVEFTYDFDESHKLADFAIVYLIPKEDTWQIADIALIGCHAGDEPVSVLTFLQERTAKATTK